MASNPPVDRREQHGMTKERYKQLQWHGADLTDEEVAAGWYFHADFDYLLIHKSWPEHDMG